MIVVYMIAAYFLGSIMAGFFVVRILGKKDIRQEGSGNVGARNAGRVHGKLAFLLTFFGDALKGVLIILIGEFFHFSKEIQLIGLLFTIIGHLKPITLHFKGGMGISTFIGGIIAFEPTTAPILIIGFLLFYPLTKSFTLAGLAAFFILPFNVYFLNKDIQQFLFVMIIVGIILFVHREDIKFRFVQRKK